MGFFLFVCSNAELINIQKQTFLGLNSSSGSYINTGNARDRVSRKGHMYKKKYTQKSCLKSQGAKAKSHQYFPD